MSKLCLVERNKKRIKLYSKYKAKHDKLLKQANNKIYKYESKRYNTINTHGTGCTLSAAISGYLAKNYSLPNAVKKAK